MNKEKEKGGIYLLLRGQCGGWGVGWFGGKGRSIK